MLVAVGRGTPGSYPALTALTHSLTRREKGGTLHAPPEESEWRT